MKHSGLILTSFLFFLTPAMAQVEQIELPRVAMMPNEPSPYKMLDWKGIAIGYDQFVYDISKNGDYLPLVFINPQGVNYPENSNFGLKSYVGSSSNNGEAINVLPSIVGATLLGVDKRNQFENDWVLMSQDFFNKKPSESVYLNNYNTSSGNDWWYDVMPNIYFYQINELYPEVGDANFQFTSIANRWSTAIETMGGSESPWSVPFMGYRAWRLSTMTPRDDGVEEPEAAGGLAWIMFNAYIKTGQQKYLTSAEWSLEYLNSLVENPSYELQLPYGVYTAAKMNALQGTQYNINKMMNWTFDRGPIRGWGAIVGTWLGYDVSGLIGEANDTGNDYAFVMNGFQQASALVPAIRYDKRFSKSIGKWVLNLANASRFFYHGNLPLENQDASGWSAIYDPDGYVGYESLREKVDGVPTILATGDAVKGGWAETNLSLYSTSSVGYLGAIVSTTNVEKILQLDLLKTDFYRQEAYPTFLYFNPYSTNKSVSVDVGSNLTDIYDAISETFLATSVQGNVSVDIPGDSVFQLVFAPANGVISYDKNKMLINDVVVDYMQTKNAYSISPRIKGLGTNTNELQSGTSTIIYSEVEDADSETITYSWFINNIAQAQQDAQLSWTAPETPGDYEIKLVVEDPDQNTAVRSLTISVLEFINTAPEIDKLMVSKGDIIPAETIEITCVASDFDEHPLTYSWEASDGSIVGTGKTVSWTSPNSEGIYSVKVVVNDGNGGEATDSISLMVKDYTASPTGKLIAYYPFDLNAEDKSGYNHNGIVNGAKIVDDRNGNINQAYSFDGVNDYIEVANTDILNFINGISASCWVKADDATGKNEYFILSHGSWQNRWKLSISNGKLRWTVKTDDGIIDVDSKVIMEDGMYYHVTGTYDGTMALLYVNGYLEDFKPITGNIKTTSYDFLIGRMLPGDDNNYNHKGDIDEVVIHDYALSPDQVIQVMNSEIVTAIENDDWVNDIKVYPNPSSGKVFIEVTDRNEQTSIIIRDIHGKKMASFRPGSNSKMHEIDISAWSNGIYYIQIQGVSSIHISKLLLLK